VAQALAERPQLKLDVPLQIVADGDAAALAHTALEQAVTSFLQKNADRVAALTAVYAKEMGKPPAYPETTDKTDDKTAARQRYLEDELLKHFIPTAAQTEELARNRGNAVRDAVLVNTEISAERIFLSARAIDPKSTSSVNAVRMELKLE
jgi:hypothetical protein